MDHSWRSGHHDYCYGFVSIVTRNRRSPVVLLLWQFQPNRHDDGHWPLPVYYAHTDSTLARICCPATRSVNTWRLCRTSHRRRTPALRLFRMEPKPPSSAILYPVNVPPHLRACVSSYRTYAASPRPETDRVDLGRTAPYSV